MKMKKYVVVVVFENPNGYLSSRCYYYGADKPLAVGGKYKIENENGFKYENPAIVSGCYSTHNNSLAQEKYATYVTHNIAKAIPVGVQVSEQNDKIKGVWFNKDKKTTVVKWHDGTVTKVTAQPEDAFNMEHGLALCYMKRWCFDNRGSFNEVFKKWIPENYPKEEAANG